MSSDLSVNDYCRLCTNSLKVKYESNLGKQGHSSSVFFLPSPSFRITIFTLSYHNCVAVCYFVVNVLDLTLKSYKLSKINSPVNPGMLEAQHQTNCNRIVFNVI